MILTLILGALVGWLASIAMKTNAQMGWIANVVVGVVGSVMGVWIAWLLGFHAVGILRLLLAFAGASLLIFILQKAGVLAKGTA